MPVTARHAAVAIALLAGCSFAAETAGVENRCSSDAQCPGAVCDTHIGMCVAVPDHALRIALQITPATDATGGTPTTHTFGPFEVDGPGQRDVTLHPAISVFGLVRWAGIEGGVPADILFTRIDPEVIRNVPAVTRETATLSAPAEAADGALANYGVRVLQDRFYDVTVTPTGEAARLLPPLRALVEIGKFDAPADFVRFNFTYPDELTTVRGIIVDSDEVPIRTDLQVQAVDPSSGAIVSSSTTTDPATGEFTIYLDPLATDWVFRISGGADRPEYPTLLADPAYFFPDDTGYVRILVPTLTPVYYTGWVYPKDASSGDGIPNATLTFRSTDVFDETTGVTGSFRATAASDSDGRYGVRLVPGTYDVIVTPPDEVPTADGDGTMPSPYGVVVEQGIEIRLPAMGGELVGQTFEVPARASVGGQVLTSTGEQVTGATVQAIALGRPGATAAAQYNRSGDATTDATGQFTMRLDFGTYDIAIKPAPESGFSWLVRPGQSFASTEPITPPYELAAPVPVSGAVVRADSTAPTVAGAEVRAWALIEEEDGTTRAVQIGRTMTREDGTYTLLLPSRL